jgi:hypothetical protein
MSYDKLIELIGAKLKQECGGGPITEEAARAFGKRLAANFDRRMQDLPALVAGPMAAAKTAEECEAIWRDAVDRAFLAELLH